MSIDRTKPDLKSPLQRREVQWTLASLASIVLVAILFSWNSRVRFERAFPNNESPGVAANETKKFVGVQIDINDAHAYELALLPGVGPVLADRIVEDRDRNGEFTSIDDLRRVFGIGEKTIEEISRLCVVSDGPISPNEYAERDESSR